MVKVILASLVMGLLLVGCVSVVSHNNIEEVEDNMEEVYQGPVPEGYNLEHFRKTGKTIKEVFE